MQAYHHILTYPLFKHCLKLYLARRCDGLLLLREADTRQRWNSPDVLLPSRA
jgi:hypothetical protein